MNLSQALISIPLLFLAVGIKLFALGHHEIDDFPLKAVVLNEITLIVLSTIFGMALVLVTKEYYGSHDVIRILLFIHAGVLDGTVMTQSEFLNSWWVLILKYQFLMVACNNAIRCMEVVPGYNFILGWTSQGCLIIGEVMELFRFQYEFAKKFEKKD